MTTDQLVELFTHFREVTNTSLHLVKGFNIVKRHDTPGAPRGVDFTVENPKALEQLIRNNTSMAEDPGHKGHYAPWSTRERNFGFTQVTQPSIKTTKWPKALHIDFAIGKSACPCGIHLDTGHRVVGRDRNGSAVFDYANHPTVKYVIHEVGLRRIPLSTFNLRPIRVYEEPEPLGFDFESSDMAAIESVVRSLSTHNEPSHRYIPGLPRLDVFDFDKKPKTDAPFRHDNSRDVTGWVGNRVTLGQGYREKGFGPRVHIELDQDSKLGNVHLDAHPYLNADGTPSVKHAIDHGIYDLSSGMGFGGRSKRFTWQAIAGITWAPKGGKDSGELGRPVLKSVEGNGPNEGWTFSVGIEFRQRTKRPRR